MRPRVWSVPPAPSNQRAVECIELAESVGLTLDPWQKFVLEGSLGTTDTGKWAAFESGTMVSRQNGKGAILEARELAGLFEWGERMIQHTAHMVDTSMEAFLRLLHLIEGSEELSRRVKKVRNTNGQEGIELLTGERIRFRTRSKGGGRGFSGDTLILDEAMFLTEFSIGALLPTLSARPNPQVWYMGSAVDQFVHDHGVVFARIRARGQRGSDPSLAWFEYSLPFDTPDNLTPDILEDVASWRMANPAFGIRITEQHIRKELASMNRRTFAVERLGVGDWPDPDAHEEEGISVEDWLALTDLRSVLLDPVVLTFDVTPDRAFSCIAATGERADGLVHTEIAAHAAGTAWVAERMAGYVERYEVAEVVCDSASPAASLVPDMEKLGVKVRLLSAQEYAQACGRLVDAVDQRTIRHLGTGELVEAIDNAVTRTLGDAWAWSRRKSSGDICPLVAVSLGVFVCTTEGPSVYEERDVLVV